MAVAVGLTSTFAKQVPGADSATNLSEVKVDDMLADEACADNDSDKTASLEFIWLIRGYLFDRCISNFENHHTLWDILGELFWSYAENINQKGKKYWGVMNDKKCNDNDNLLPTLIAVCSNLYLFEWQELGLK